MPYSSMEDVNPALKGIKPPVTLAQANLIARMADGMENAENVDNPWAAAIGQFKRMHQAMDGKWVKKAPVGKMMMSLDEKEMMVRMAWEDKFMPTGEHEMMGMHDVKVYDNFVVAKTPKDGMQRYPYTMLEHGIEFQAPENVEMEYVVVQKLDEIKELLKGWLSTKNKSISSEGKEEFTLEAPIVKADEERHLVYGVVLVPDKLDKQDDIADPLEIEKAAHAWMVRGLTQTSDLMDDQHQIIVSSEKARPVESYIAPVDFELGTQNVVKGSWVLVTHVPDVELWEAIKKGERKAYSIKGYGKRTPVST